MNPLLLAAAPGPWTYRFDEYGGYDTLTAGFIIVDANGNDIFVLDVENFDHAEPRPERIHNTKHPDYQKSQDAFGAWLHRRSPAAEALAQWLCEQSKSIVAAKE